MNFSNFGMRQCRKGIVQWIILTGVFLIAAVQANAAEHFVPSSTSTINCTTYGGGIKPGDTITLNAGNRGPLTVRNCTGTAANPITIRNDPTGSGPTVIRRATATSGGFIFTCRDCVHVAIDGTGRWKGASQGAYCGAPSGTNGCGIKITSIAANDSPSAYLKLNGRTTKVSVRGIEIDGRLAELKSGGVGISQNDHNIKAADFPNLWREDIVYENNYIHDVGNSAMYIGPNWREPDLDIPLRNITIRHNLLENAGRDGIKLKMAIGGTNRIHHNVIRRTGLRGELKFADGIAILDGGRNLKIYNNWVEATGARGIQHGNWNIPSDFGSFESEIFNNVIYGTGKLSGTSNDGHGINIASGSNSAAIFPIAYNNTIVRTSHDGINFGSRVTGGVARDNIIAAWGTSALSVGNNSNMNNRTGSIASMKFIDAGNLNFALASDSPARNGGSETGFPSNDYVNMIRPQGGKADQGAFEYSSAIAAPKPPDMSTVR